MAAIRVLVLISKLLVILFPFLSHISVKFNCSKLENI
jgi:hypothetical protein